MPIRCLHSRLLVEIASKGVMHISLYICPMNSTKDLYLNEEGGFLDLCCRGDKLLWIMRINMEDVYYKGTLSVTV